MKIIDLTWVLKDGKEYYPWDPKVEIKNIQIIDKDWWNLKQIKINSHDWTHVNVPIHCKIWGKTLDDYSVDDFIWKSVLYESIEDIRTWYWIIFDDIDITFDIAYKIVELKPQFVWLSDKFEFNIEVEKYLLENDIISFERLTNTNKLPKSFIFHWVPLKIKEWDWSPVRAYAILQ